MAWDEFTFQQQFSLDIGQTHKLPETLRKKSAAAFANFAYGSILSVVRTLRQIPGLPRVIRAALEFLGTLSTPVRWMFGMVLLWWVGAMAGLLAGLLFP